MSSCRAEASVVRLSVCLSVCLYSPETTCGATAKYAAQLWGDCRHVGCTPQLMVPNLYRFSFWGATILLSVAPHNYCCPCGTQTNSALDSHWTSDRVVRWRHHASAGSLCCFGLETNMVIAWILYCLLILLIFSRVRCPAVMGLFTLCVDLFWTGNKHGHCLDIVLLVNLLKSQVSSSYGHSGHWKWGTLDKIWCLGLNRLSFLAHFIDYCHYFVSQSLGTETYMIWTKLHGITPL
jgi:hypothetical protein